MSNCRLTFLAVATFWLSACASTPKIDMTPLEIQAMQTREFEEDYDIVFRSVVSVFQDLGYTIKNADKETGFIQADGIADSNEALKFWLGSTKTTQTKATAFVEPMGSTTRARISFVTAVEKSTAYGAEDREEMPILDAQIYQNAFEKIENAIFVRKATN